MHSNLAIPDQNVPVLIFSKFSTITVLITIREEKYSTLCFMSCRNIFIPFAKEEMAAFLIRSLFLRSRGLNLSRFG